MDGKSFQFGRVQYVALGVHNWPRGRFGGDVIALISPGFYERDIAPSDYGNTGSEAYRGRYATTILRDFPL